MLVFLVFSLFLGFTRSEIAEPEEQVLLTNNDYDSKFYRIPAIVTAADGSLVTATDKRIYHTGDLPQAIDVMIRRSTDHGKTWTPAKLIAGEKTESFGYGDCSLVVDPKTGAIMCIFNGGPGIGASTPEVPTRQYYCISHDNGITWSDPIEFTKYIYGINCTDEYRATWRFTFVTAGRALALRDGRIMAVGVMKPPNKGYHNYAIYTDNLGKTWHVGSGAACTAGDEAKVVELNNGSVLMSIRNGSGHRYFSISNDRGDTWEPLTHRYELVDPYCNGEIFRYTSTLDGYDKNRLIHTNLHSSSGRKNLTIKISYDEGDTWPFAKVIYAGNAQYSTGTIDTDGTIWIYWERDLQGGGFDMVLTHLTIDWVTDGADTYKPPTKSTKSSQNDEAIKI